MITTTKTVRMVETNIVFEPLGQNLPPEIESIKEQFFAQVETGLFSRYCKTITRTNFFWHKMLHETEKKKQNQALKQNLSDNQIIRTILRLYRMSINNY